MEWKSIPAKQNPADIRSPVSSISKLGDIWWKSFTSLSNVSLWLCQATLNPTTESQAESKVITKIMTITIEKSKAFHKLLQKHEL